MSEELEQKVKEMIGDPKADLSAYSVEQLQDYVQRATQYGVLLEKNTAGLAENELKAYHEALVKVKDSPAMSIQEMHEYAEGKLKAFQEANKPVEEPDTEPDPEPDPGPVPAPVNKPQVQQSRTVIVDDKNPAPLANDEDYFNHLFTNWQKTTRLVKRNPYEKG